jgi:DNA-binding MarR family transcriptional regulator
MAARKKLSKSQFEDLAAFRYALRQFLQFSETAAKSAGITPQQHQALLAVKGFPGRDTVTVGELAERLRLRHHSTVELVDRLVALRLVARAHSGVDRRQAFVRLSARGERVLAGLSSAHEEQLRRIGPELSTLLGRLTAGQG